jgi:hypothetical protein
MAIRQILQRLFVDQPILLRERAPAFGRCFFSIDTFAVCSLAFC